VFSQVQRILAVILAITLGLVACGGENATVKEHFTKGNELAGAGEYDKAIEEYKAALQAEPNNVSVLTNLGVAYYNTGQLDQAVTQYQTALENAPNDADIHSNLAAAYVQQGKLDEAQAEYERAVELQPDLAPAHFGLGVVYSNQGANDEAIQAFEKFLEFDTGNDPIASEQAQQYLNQLRGQ
jgi:tetratricopeptide (TPR) repeat protein